MTNLTNKEMATIAKLFDKASADDMRLIAEQYNYASTAKTRAKARSFSVGDTVTWNGKRGFMEGVVKKVNPKNIVVATATAGTWNVTASLLKKV